MAQYTVKRAQNIFDVAIELYGSVEGLYDLLISNEWLSMDYELKAGDILEYHESFVINQGVLDDIAENRYMAANGERHVYLKHTELPCIFQVDVPNDMDHSTLKVMGEGEMLVDWGDNSDFQEIELTHLDTTITHYFDNKTDRRVIKIYGDFSLLFWDATDLNGQIFTLRPVTVDEFSCKANDYPLEGLFLFNGTVKLDLGGMFIDDLSPIYNMSLQELDLRSAHIEADTVDAYLTNIVSNYGSRRNCTVYLTREPGEAGMEAIETIINEPAWNESGAWVFDINGQIYTAS